MPSWESLEISGPSGVVVLDGAHHGLAVDGDAVSSAEIPGVLVRAVLSYLPLER